MAKKQSTPTPDQEVWREHYGNIVSGVLGRSGTGLGPNYNNDEARIAHAAALADLAMAQEKARFAQADDPPASTERAPETEAPSEQPARTTS